MASPDRPERLESPVQSALPPEVWALVIRSGGLDFHELLVLGRTCKMLRDLATDQTLWRELYRHRFPNRFDKREERMQEKGSNSWKTVLLVDHFYECMAHIWTGTVLRLTDDMLVARRMCLHSGKLFLSKGFTNTSGLYPNMGKTVRDDLVVSLRKVIEMQCSASKGSGDDAVYFLDIIIKGSMKNKTVTVGLKSQRARAEWYEAVRTAAVNSRECRGFISSYVPDGVYDSADAVRKRIYQPKSRNAPVMPARGGQSFCID